jgi:phosphoserine phosphatase
MPYVLTLVAARHACTLTDAAIARVRDLVDGGAPRILSPGEAADIPCRAVPDADAVAGALDHAAIDAITTPSRNRRKGLLVADMDSTIVTGETLDELAAHAGVGEAIAAITRRSMNGEIDFADALRARVAMLAGLRLEVLEATWRATRLTEGARELVATMRAHNATTALVSGGFGFFTARVADALGFDVHLANTLLDDGVALTGAVAEPILDRGAKLAALRRLAAERRLQPAATLAIGDGANDLDMLREAGLGLAFHAKPVVAEQARHCIAHASLRAALFAQGYAIGEFV